MKPVSEWKSWQHVCLGFVLAVGMAYPVYWLFLNATAGTWIKLVITYAAIAQLAKWITRKMKWYKMKSTLTPQEYAFIVVAEKEIGETVRELRRRPQV